MIKTIINILYFNYIILYQFVHINGSLVTYQLTANTLETTVENKKVKDTVYLKKYNNPVNI